MDTREAKEEAVIRRLEEATSRQESRTQAFNGQQIFKEGDRVNMNNKIRRPANSNSSWTVPKECTTMVTQVKQNQAHLITDNNTVTWQAAKYLTPLQEALEEEILNQNTQAAMHHVCRKTLLLPPKSLPPAILMPKGDEGVLIGTTGSTGAGEEGDIPPPLPAIPFSKVAPGKRREPCLNATTKGRTGSSMARHWRRWKSM